MQLLDSQIDLRRRKVLFSPLKSRDEVFAAEYMKGEASAFELVRRLPEVLIDDIKAELQLRERRKNQEEVNNG